MLRIGSSQSDITPAPPILMGGTFLKLQSREVLDPLMASCVVADDGCARVAMVSCDLGSVPRDMVLSIREQVNRATGTPDENIRVMATHNHSAPTVFPISDLPFHDDDDSSQVAETRWKLADDIAACVIEAHDRLVPARMGYGRGRFEGGAFNRRFIMSNGRSRMHGREEGDLKRLRAEGPVDPEVQVVWFEDSDGRHLAVMVNYASHVTNLYGVPTVSADFPGVMRDVLQGVLGDDVAVLYLQGACGNVMCRDVENPNFPKRMDNARHIGRSLAGEALKIMGESFADAEEVGVSACCRILEIPYRDVPPLPVEQAREQWAYYETHWDEFLRLDIEARASIMNTLRIAGYKQQASAAEAEIAAFALGDVFFVGNPAELFVEYQLDIKERFQGRKVIVTELTNGRIGYVPTKLACALGGYETIGTRFNPGAGDLIRDVSCGLVETLMG